MKKFALHPALALVTLGALASLCQAVTMVPFTDADRLTESGSRTATPSFAYNAGTSDALLAGDSSDNQGVFEVATTFDISGVTASEIANARLIQVTFSYDMVLGGGTDVMFYGFERSSTTLTDASGFSASGRAGTLVGSVTAASLAASETLTFDVTALLKSYHLRCGGVPHLFPVPGSRTEQQQRLRPSRPIPS